MPWPFGRVDPLRYLIFLAITIALLVDGDVTARVIGGVFASLFVGAGVLYVRKRRRASA